MTGADCLPVAVGGGIDRTCAFVASLYIVKQSLDTAEHRTSSVVIAVRTLNLVKTVAFAECVSCGIVAFCVGVQNNRIRLNRFSMVT